MLQSLTDITDKEIYQIADMSIKSIENLCSSVENVKSAFEVTPYNTNKTAFQKCIELYPTLLNDKYTKHHLKDIKDSLIKKYRSGKLQINGKFTFVLPDFYAACEHWFMLEDNPKGLLNDGEVFCWLFTNYDKLDCLRSPHLYREHPVRNNLAYYENIKSEELREWFTTNAVYVSCHDMISRIVQCDYDGDRLLCVADKTFVQVAERNMKNIVPLYYEMKKAMPHIINNDVIYEGLILAFTGGNIGIYSNNISKIWNSETFLSGTDEEKQNALNYIKCLTAQNNWVID